MRPKSLRPFLRQLSLAFFQPFDLWLARLDELGQLLLRETLGFSEFSNTRHTEAVADRPSHFKNRIGIFSLTGVRPLWYKLRYEAC